MNCLTAPLLSTILAQGIAPPGDPTPAPPPRVDAEDVLGADLERMDAARSQREAASAPKPPTPNEKRVKSLERETYAKRPRRVLAEVSLLFGTAVTSGDKSGYTVDPTSHFNAFVRKTSDTSLWYGLRIAPFAGTGYYKRKPGTYGLTFFGPMIGVGKIDPVPAARGTAAEEPVTGWLVTAGIAALNKSGRSETAERSERFSDLSAKKGVLIDGTGLWTEARYLRVLYGALGVDAVFGIQTGRGRQLIYGGIGAGGYY